MSLSKRLIRILAGTPNCRSLPQEARKTVSVFPGIHVSRHSAPGEVFLEIVHTHCAGLDVHKKTVVAAIIVPDEKGDLWKDVRTPDLVVLADYFQDDGEVVASTGHPRVKALLDEVIGQVNSQLDRWEQIREYHLLDQPLTQDSGELTPSMKISRHVVAERYPR